MRGGRVIDTPPALRAALAEEVRGVTLSRSFFDARLAPALAREPLLEVRRVLAADARTAWSVLTDPAWLSLAAPLGDVHVSGGGTLRAGARIRARGAIAERLPSRDETTITRVVEGSLLAWTTRARPRLSIGTIEFRWSIEITETDGGCEALHRLWGVAFPPALAGRLLRRSYEKIEGSMYPSMHRGFERLATLIEQRARRT